MKKQLLIYLAASAIAAFLLLTATASAKTLQFKSTLKRGSFGEEVKKLQKFLITMPNVYPKGAVTGYFGAATQKAVKKIQSKYGLDPTGITNLPTRNKINELIAKLSAPPLLSAPAKAPPSPQPPLAPDTSSTSAQSARTEQFIIAAPVDLAQISQISKFRSCAGHDFSGLNAYGQTETNRSMKHYFAPINTLTGSSGAVKIFAPFAGTIKRIQSEQMPRGEQVWLQGDSTNGWLFVFFHVDLLPNYQTGSAFQTGDLLGYANLNRAHDFDIALRKMTLFTESIDTIFSHFDKSVTAEFQTHGVATDTAIILKSARDHAPCNWGNDNADDWVAVK